MTKTAAAALNARSSFLETDVTGVSINSSKLSSLISFLKLNFSSAPNTSLTKKIIIRIAGIKIPLFWKT